MGRSFLGASGRPSARVLGTTAFKVALANAVAFALASIVLSGLFFIHARGRVLEQIDSDIAADGQVLLATLQERGLPETIAAVARRVEGVAGRVEAHYLLIGPDGRMLAGNLPVIRTPFGWSWVTVPPDERGLEDGLLRAWTEHLPGGGRLLVGRNPRRLDELEDTVFTGLLWSELGTLLFGLASGYLVSRRVLRGVATVADAAARIGAGDLTHRIPPVGRGTEIATIGSAVNLMLDRVGALTDSLRQVTDDIAHDLRTPLGRLRQNLERATRSAGTVEALQTAIDAALDEADAIIDTFNALLRIAQIEGQDRRESFAVVALSGLLVRLAEIYGPSAEDTGRRFHATIAPGIEVWGDADLLGQMAANLIENALHHTPEGSVLDVSLYLAPAGHPRLVVADNGPGIPVAERERVLGRFVRLDTSRGTPGTGLGLALVKAIADLHGIALVLEDGEPGLRVVLDFPSPPRPAAAGAKLSER